MVQQQQRPLGVTILAVLAFIGGILNILGGIGGFALGGGWAFFGAIYLILGILELGLGYGFWTLKPWAWMLGITLQAISIVLSIIYIVGRNSVASDIIDILVAAGIIYYLTRPQIRQVFGR